MSENECPYSVGVKEFEALRVHGISREVWRSGPIPQCLPFMDVMIGPILLPCHEFNWMILHE